MPPNILLVTEPGGGASVARALDEAGHQVNPCYTLIAACDALTQEGIDLTLTDIGQSALDLGTAVASLRARTPAPIVHIDSGAPDELRQVLKAGADDFLSKPFTAVQLHARITVVLAARRPRLTGPVTVGGIHIDPQQRRAWLDGDELHLSRREFDLLRCLASRAGQVVSRDELASAVWPATTKNFRRTMDVHLSWLRHKLGDTAAKPRYLKTIRGVGFTLVADTAHPLLTRSRPHD